MLRNILILKYKFALWSGGRIVSYYVSPTLALSDFITTVLNVNVTVEYVLKPICIEIEHYSDKACLNLP